MSDDELYKKLSAELDIIREEVVNLREKQHMFWELQKIIGANQDINVSNEFYDWIEEIYTTSMSVAIRRQVDGSKDSISFRRFLEEVGRHPCVVTRKRYSTFFSSSSDYLPGTLRRSADHVRRAEGVRRSLAHCGRDCHCPDGSHLQ